MKRIKSTLCALVLAASTALAQGGPPPGEGWQEYQGMLGADGRPVRAPDMTPQGKPWDACGKTYREQFNTYYDTFPGEHHEITRKEKKHLEKVVIPYAMSLTLNITFEDIDGDGGKDYFAFRSDTRVPPCTMEKNYLQKNNHVQIDFKNGTQYYHEWVGGLVSRVEIMKGTTLLRVYEVDVSGVETMRYLNWRTPPAVPE